MKKFVFAVLFALLASVANVGHTAPINFGPSTTAGTFANGTLVDNGIIHFTYSSHNGQDSSSNEIGLNDASPVDSSESGDTTIGFTSSLTIGSSSTNLRLSKVGSSTALTGQVAVLVSVDSALPDLASYGITGFFVAQSGPANLVTTGAAYATYMNGTYSDPIATTDDGNGSYTFGDSVQSFYLLLNFSAGGIYSFNVDIFTTYTAPNTSVPEPSTLAVFGGIAALGLVAIRRRRQG